MWIKYLKDKENFHPWKVVANWLLSSVRGAQFFTLILSPQYKDKVKGGSTFHRNLIHVWTMLSDGRELDPNDEELLLSNFQ